jgi:hypothetical protein
VAVVVHHKHLAVVQLLRVMVVQEAVVPEQEIIVVVML